VDNAAWALGVALDPLLAAALEGAERVLVVQLADVASLSSDDSVQIALVSAADTDGDPSDNADGESFSAGPAVDEAGRAVAGVEAELTSGIYGAELLDETLVIGEVELSTATPLHIAGQLDEEMNQGLMGFGISVEVLGAALEAAGYPDEAALIAELADLDLDGDGEAEALSVALSFEAVACSLSP
jgi:hypothetical protein